MLGITFHLRWTNSYLGWTVTTRSRLGTRGESDFGESNHKVAEFIFLIKREMQEQGQRDAAPKLSDFDTHGEAVGSSWGSRRVGTVRESPGAQGTGHRVVYPAGGRQKTQPPTPAVLLQTQGQHHEAEGGGNRGSWLHICSQTPLLQNHVGRDA